MGLLSVGSFKRTIVRDMEHIQNMTSNQLIKLPPPQKKNWNVGAISKASARLALFSKALTFRSVMSKSKKRKIKLRISAEKSLHNFRNRQWANPEPVQASQGR